MPHPLNMFYGNLAQLGKKSNSVIRSRSVMVKNWCNVLSMEGVTVNVNQSHYNIKRVSLCVLLITRLLRLVGRLGTRKPV